MAPVGDECHAERHLNLFRDRKNASLKYAGVIKFTLPHKKMPYRHGDLFLKLMWHENKFLNNYIKRLKYAPVQLKLMIIFIVNIFGGITLLGLSLSFCGSVAKSTCDTEEKMENKQFLPTNI